MNLHTHLSFSVTPPSSERRCACDYRIIAHRFVTRTVHSRGFDAIAAEDPAPVSRRSILEKFVAVAGVLGGSDALPPLGYARVPPPPDDQHSSGSDQRVLHCPNRSRMRGGNSRSPLYVNAQTVNISMRRRTGCSRKAMSNQSRGSARTEMGCVLRGGTQHPQYARPRRQADEPDRAGCAQWGGRRTSEPMKEFVPPPLSHPRRRFWSRKIWRDGVRLWQLSVS